MLAAIEGFRCGNSIGTFYLRPLASAVADCILPFETVLHAYEQWWRTRTPWPVNANGKNSPRAHGRVFSMILPALPRANSRSPPPPAVSFPTASLVL